MRGRLWFDDRRDHWVVILELGKKADGSRWTESKGGFAKKGQAQDYLDQRIAEHVQGTFAPSNKITVAEWCDLWLKSCVPTMELANGTVENYERSVRLHIVPELGRVSLQKLDRLTIQRAMVAWDKKLAPSSRQQVMIALKLLLKDAVESGYIRVSPASKIKLGKPRRTEMNALDEKQTAALLTALKGTRAYLPTLLAATTGMRRGEVIGLKWDAIEDDKLTVRQQITDSGEVRPPKSARGERTITLAPVVYS